ncbi:MFS general substrate transporter [Melanomma pulvis-pyrius CBS 109.77]|uniref:MFS general substrate transporter n=1 Tax=Melanomma pulvis-pyrius CBS 109.77 TaxID=1314802 RepID=A0A6A6WTP7_9PLEO|nr:MFS general substrate transporter [Melanomma pulvis-pyrius CBS 109.77]
MPSSRCSSSEDGPIIKVSDESTPLLSAITSGPITEPVEAAPQPNGIYDQDEDAPLPKVQIFLLCIARIVDPIAFFTIFPYINQMIKDTGVKEVDVGFYSGLIESLYSATQMCVMIFWGKASDRFGRKPILALSLYGIMVATALFGMSKTLGQMILFRCTAGVFAGTLVTVRAMITENSTKKTQARAFTYFAFAGNLGVFIGSFLGGGLESPAKKFPSTFGRIAFFREYPYAFPGFVVAFIGLIAAILATFFINETLHFHRGRKSDAPPMSTWELIKAPGVKQVMMIFNYVSLLAFAYTAAHPVFLFTSVKLGGIGFTPSLIALFLALAGASQAFWLLVVFPPLHRRLGTGFILRACAIAWPFFFLVSPMCNILLRYDHKIVFWILAPTALAIGSGVAMAFIASQLIVNDIAPSHETLGELNALVLAVSSGLRAVVPAGSTTLYAIGVKYHIFGGQMFWMLLIIIACGLIFLLRVLPEKAEGRPQPEESEQA